MRTIILPIMKVRNLIMGKMKVRTFIMGKMKVRTLILALSNVTELLLLWFWVLYIWIEKKQKKSWSFSGSRSKWNGSTIIADLDRIIRILTRFYLWLICLFQLPNKTSVTTLRRTRPTLQLQHRDIRKNVRINFILQRCKKLKEE